jgi:D-alanyl-D-alanine carboxypeptidase
VTGEPFYQYLRETVLTAAHLDAPAANVFNAYTDRDKLQVTGYISYAMQPPRVLPLEASATANSPCPPARCLPGISRT